MDQQTLKTNRAAAILLIVETVLVFMPLIILGSAINWPASLGDPASIALPRLLENASAVRLGYLVYLVYSLLFWPLSYLTARVVDGGEGRLPFLQIAAGFGAISALARGIGIVRWLGPMPVVAQIYVDAAGSVETQAAVSALFEGLNDYGGTIGELLGVNLLAGLWLLCVAIPMLQRPSFPRWLGIYGLIVSVSLVGGAIAVLFGVDAGLLSTITVTMLHIWMLAMAVILLRQK